MARIMMRNKSGQLVTLKSVRKRARIQRLRRKIYRRGFEPSVHKVTERVEVNPITASTGGTTSGVLQWNLQQILNYPSIKALYDLYKIVGVKVTLVPQWSMSQIGSGSSGNTFGLPLLGIAPNRSPYSTAPGSLNDVLNDDYCKLIRLTKPVSLFLKYPKPLLLDKDAAPVSNFTFNNNMQPWLSTGGNAQAVDQSLVNHLGYKYWLDNTNFQGNATVRVFVKLYIKLKEMD